MSIGIPRTATSVPSSLSQSGHAGWRANVARPTKGMSIRSAVAAGVIGCHCNVLPLTGETHPRLDGDRSADLVGELCEMESQLERILRHGHCGSWRLHLIRRPCDAVDPYEHPQV